MQARLAAAWQHHAVGSFPAPWRGSVAWFSALPSYNVAEVVGSNPIPWQEAGVAPGPRDALFFLAERARQPA